MVANWLLIWVVDKYVSLDSRLQYIPWSLLLALFIFIIITIFVVHSSFEAWVGLIIYYFFMLFVTLALVNNLCEQGFRYLLLSAYRFVLILIPNLTTGFAFRKLHHCNSITLLMHTFQYTKLYENAPNNGQTKAKMHADKIESYLYYIKYCIENMNSSRIRKFEISREDDVVFLYVIGKTKRMYPKINYKEHRNALKFSPLSRNDIAVVETEDSKQPNQYTLTAEEFRIKMRAFILNFLEE